MLVWAFLGQKLQFLQEIARLGIVVPEIAVFAGHFSFVHPRTNESEILKILKTVGLNTWSHRFGPRLDTKCV